ncbi:tricarballylate dehydrogenase [Verticillium dahliae]|nr:tricarballylate dehydrogenase [Verticillium dahliae]
MALAGYCDILVVGSGNAGFSAAISAAESGTARVLLIDTCPEEWAGGNTYFTAGAYRTAHGGLQDVLPLVNNVSPEQKVNIELAPYLEQHFSDDIERVCSGRSDPKLARILVKDSNSTIKWLASHGICFQLSFNRQAYEVGGKIKFWGDGTQQIIEAKAIIFAAGGFESNLRMRSEHLGPGWDRAMVRGTPFNTGACLELCLRDLNANAVGDWSGCHSVAWDAAANPTTGDREASNEYTKSGYPLGLMINIHGHRFVDEGVDFRNYTYAKFGRAILSQPEHVAFQVWDARGAEWLRDEEYRPERVERITADSIELLAQKCASRGLHDTEQFSRTIRDYNEAVYGFQQENPDAAWDPAVKDGYSTQSSIRRLDLPKSNWALPLDRGPFVAVKVTCGITFTFGGLQVEPKSAQLINAKDGNPMQGLYCVGEMLGGLFYGNYPGGSGLMSGAVFGRRAGRAAAEAILKSTTGPI